MVFMGAVFATVGIIILLISLHLFIVSQAYTSTRRNSIIFSIVGVGLLITALIVAILKLTASPSISYPHLAPIYQGSAYNTTFNITATLALTSIVQNQGEISGNVNFGPGLIGSGSFTGTIRSDGSISFTDAPILFIGLLHADGSLGGTYTVSGGDEEGTWQTTPS